MPETIESRLKLLQGMQENFDVAGRNIETGEPTTQIPVNTIKYFDKVFFRQQLDNEIIMELDAETRKENTEIWFSEVNPILLKNKFTFEIWITRSKSTHGSLFFKKPISNEKRKAFIEFYFKELSKRTYINKKGKETKVLDDSFWTKEGKGQLIALEHAIHYRSGKEKIRTGAVGKYINGKPEINLSPLDKEGELNDFPDIPIPKETETQNNKPSEPTTNKTHLDILNDKNASENDRVKAIRKITKIHEDWNAETVADYVAEKNCWEDYDSQKTREKIDIIFNSYVTPEKKELENIEYSDVINAYKKWFYVTPETEEAIDLMLAVAITTKEKGKPIWIILVAPSGANKTGLLTPLENKDTITLSKISPNTFLSGKKYNPEEKDFAYFLSNNPKLFITPDFAQFLKLKSEQKQEIWSQLRDLYDGFIDRKACGTDKRVENIKFNWIICSTPAIDSELLIHSELGTRELLFRFNEEEAIPDSEENNDLMEAVWNNQNKEGQIKKEISAVAVPFIKRKENGTMGLEVPEKIKEKIMQTAQTITKLRASAESDNYTGELTNFVYPEKPTRILKQLKSIYLGLKKLDENYSDEKAIKIIEKIALSSIHPTRLKIILKVIENTEMTTTQIQKSLGLGWKTVNTQLSTAWQLKILDYEELDEGEEKERKKKVWHTKPESVVIKFLKEASDLSEWWDGLQKKYRSESSE